MWWSIIKITLSVNIYCAIAAIIGMLAGKSINGWFRIVFMKVLVLSVYSNWWKFISNIFSGPILLNLWKPSQKDWKPQVGPRNLRLCFKLIKEGWWRWWSLPLPSPHHTHPKRKFAECFHNKNILFLFFTHASQSIILQLHN